MIIRTSCVRNNTDSIEIQTESFKIMVQPRTELTHLYILTTIMPFMWPFDYFETTVHL